MAGLTDSVADASYNDLSNYDYFYNVDSDRDDFSDNSENNVPANTECNPTLSDITVGMKNILLTGDSGIHYPFPPDEQPIDYFFVLCDSVFLKNVCSNLINMHQKLPQKIQGHELLGSKI